MSSSMTGPLRGFYGWLWNFVCPLLKAPTEPPKPPDGPGRVVAVMHPDPAYLKWQMFWMWLTVALVSIAPIVLLGALAATFPIAAAIVSPFVGLFLAFKLFVIWVGMHLNYDSTYYVITDRSIRIRRGIWIVQEMTFTYANVQNVKIEQGPLERYFGIGSVILDTAGGGGHAGHSGVVSFHRAVMAGIVDTVALRDLIQKHLRVHGTSGLGDHGDHASATHEIDHQRLAEVLEAARRLRTAAEKSASSS